MAIGKSISLFSLCLSLAVPALPQAQPTTITVTTVATFPFSLPKRAFASPLIEGAGGNFYGVTKSRGQNDLGTAFLMTPQGGLKILFDFDGTQGVSPIGPLLEGRGGYLFGTTIRGGAYKQGTVFKMSRSGTIQALHNFVCTPTNCPDGKYPSAGLVRGLDGWFYGTTTFGGVNHRGVVFRIGPNGTYEILSSFAPPDGRAGTLPAGALLLASDGGLYGLSDRGGAYKRGSIFKVTPQGQITLVHSFGALPTGSAFPMYSLIQGADGDLYGINNFNGGSYTGTLFKVSLQGGYHKVYDFHSFYPAGTPIQASDGNFWGDFYSDSESGVYEISPSGSLVQLIYLKSHYGIFANSALMQGSDGKLYGAGIEAHDVIYAIDAGLPPPSPSIAGFLPAHGPVGSIVVVSGAHFVGTTGVTFNGVSAPFVVNADGVISTTVPPEASTGPIQVNNAGGFAATQIDFIVP